MKIEYLLGVTRMSDDLDKGRTICNFSLTKMKNLNEINSKIKTMLDAWSKDPSHYYGNTVTKWVVVSILIDSYGECQGIDEVALDGSTPVKAVLKAAEDVTISGTPDCDTITDIVQYISVYDRDDNKYHEKASAKWSYEEFKEFANDKICRSDKFLFEKEGWWNAYVA